MVITKEFGTTERWCPITNSPCTHSPKTYKNECFIIMSYKEKFSPLIEKILKKAIKKTYKSKPVLAKDIKIRGSYNMFCNKVCKPILDATMCVVDLTYQNNNVGFELGIAHGFNKPVIITRYVPNMRDLTDEEECKLKELRKEGVIQFSKVPSEEPSDIRGLFTVSYKTKKELLEKLKEFLPTPT